MNIIFLQVCQIWPRLLQDKITMKTQIIFDVWELPEVLCIMLNLFWNFESNNLFYFINCERSSYSDDVLSYIRSSIMYSTKKASIFATWHGICRFPAVWEYKMQIASDSYRSWRFISENSSSRKEDNLILLLDEEKN